MTDGSHPYNTFAIVTIFIRRWPIMTECVHPRPDDDEEEEARPVAKRARRCGPGALCDACAVLDAHVSARPEALTPMTLWLLTTFAPCPLARETYARAYRAADGGPTSSPLVGVGADDDSADTDDGVPASRVTDDVSLPPFADVNAWKNPVGFEARIAALQRRFTARSNARNAHPRATRIRTDFTSTRHDYYIDGVLCNARNGWYSVSGLLHFLFPEFDADFKSRCSAEGVLRDLLVQGIAASDRRPDTPLDALWALRPPTVAALEAAFPLWGAPDDKHVKPAEAPLPSLDDALGYAPPGKALVDTVVQIGAKSLRAAWNANRDRGSDKHAWYDAWLQHLPLPPLAGDDMDVTPVSAVPLGFFRAMAMLADAGYDVFSTECSLFDERRKFLGQADLILVHRTTGKILLGDFKNCKDADLGTAGNARGSGIHPFTATTPDTKLAHYEIQLGAYWHVLNTLYYPGRMEACVVLLNFRPSEPAEFRVYWLAPPRDMTALWALLPWLSDDPRHVQFSSTDVANRLLMAPVPDTDPRCSAGPTTRCSAPSLPTPPDVVWTGALYPSKRARTQAVRDGIPLRYDLPESIYKHPWSWFGAPRPGAYEYYEQHLLSNAVLLASLPQLVGKRIACWCRSAEQRCQADVLVKYANLYHCGAIALPESVQSMFDANVTRDRIVSTPKLRLVRQFIG